MHALACHVCVCVRVCGVIVASTKAVRVCLHNCVCACARIATVACICSAYVSARSRWCVYLCVRWLVHLYSWLRPPAFKPQPPLTQHICSAGGSRVHLGNDSVVCRAACTQTHIPNPSWSRLNPWPTLPNTRSLDHSASRSRARTRTHTHA